MSRIYLSPPHLSGDELKLLREALESNWIAPLGPQVDKFERELAETVQVPHAAALSSGTAALHLALLLLGVESGDEVLVPTLTFVASANAVAYVGAKPAFLDCTRASWCLDPEILQEELAERARTKRMPKAVISVDLYGQSADHDAILEACNHYDVPVIEDAAEALGATYKGRPVGGFGAFGVFSFNGNKIITTSGGGMLVGASQVGIHKARAMASQSRDDAPHYEHSQMGFNYRMSNILAAVGRGQLRYLLERVVARRQIFQRYEELLGDLPGMSFMPEAGYGRSTRWLTCLQIEPEEFGATREDVRLALEAENIESRPVWKPMHLQPLYRDHPIRGGSVAAELFEKGLCLPSGSALEEPQILKIAHIVRSTGSF